MEHISRTLERSLLCGHAKQSPSSDGAVVHPVLLLLCKEESERHRRKKGRESMETEGGVGGRGPSYNQSLQSGVLLNPAERCSFSSILFLHTTPSRAPSPQTRHTCVTPRRFHSNVSQRFSWFPKSRHLSVSDCRVNIPERPQQDYVIKPAMAHYPIKNITL